MPTFGSEHSGAKERRGQVPLAVKPHLSLSSTTKLTKRQHILVEPSSAHALRSKYCHARTLADIRTSGAFQVKPWENIPFLVDFSG
jgi:hypothetical protein